VKAGVVPNLSRKHLDYITPEGEEGYPWQKWGDEYKALMPQYVKDIIAENTHVGVSLDDLLDQVDALMDPEMDRYKMTSRGRKGGGGGGGGGGAKARNRSSRHIGFVDADPDHPIATAADSYIVINVGNQFFDEEIKYYSKRVRNWSDEAESTLRRTMFLRLALQLNHYFLSTKTRRWDQAITRDDEKAALSDSALRGQAETTLITQRDLIRRPVSGLGWDDE